MKVTAVTGRHDVAEVFMADMGGGRMIEFVEALQPPYSRDERWILMVSTLYGCPVKCLICDAGGSYQGRLTAEEILRQIDHMVHRWYPDGHVPASAGDVNRAADQFGVIARFVNLESRGRS